MRIGNPLQKELQVLLFYFFPSTAGSKFQAVLEGTLQDHVYYPLVLHGNISIDSCFSTHNISGRISTYSPKRSMLTSSRFVIKLNHCDKMECSKFVSRPLKCAIFAQNLLYRTTNETSTLHVYT